MVSFFRDTFNTAKNLARGVLGLNAGSNQDPGLVQTPPSQSQSQSNTTDSTMAAEQSDGSLKRASPHDGHDHDHDNNANSKDGDGDGGEWTVVGRPNKKPKKTPKPGKNYPAITFSKNARLQSKIGVGNLRDLVTYIFADGAGPQWVGVTHRPAFRKIVALMVPGLEEAMFQKDVDFNTYNETRDQESAAVAAGSPDSYYPKDLSKENLPEELQPFADMFPLLWPVRTPGDDRHCKMHSPMAAFLTAPAPKDKTSNKQGGGGVKTASEPKGWKNERTRITEYLATASELADNGYLVHPSLLPEGEQRDKFVLPEGWVATKVADVADAEVPEAEIEQGSVTAGREILAIDCEMCLTGEAEFSLTRISIVNWSGDVVLDELVKPAKPITDYLTRFSGITQEMLAPVTTTLSDIQQRLLDILHPRAILVGHSLESDTKALQITHPFIVDTSLLFPHPRGPPLKSSLKYLAQKYLSREIQKGGEQGHNSIEDAKTCLDLVKQKCEKGKLWGNSDSQGENLFRRLARAGTAYKAQGGEAALGGLEIGKTSAAVDWGDPSKGYGAGATYRFGCKSDDDVLVNLLRCINGDPDGLHVKAGGADFVWGRFRELEALQGWWNTNRSDTSNSDGGPPSAAAAAAAPLSSSTSSSAGGSGPALKAAVANLTAHISAIHDALPPCTALILYSGSGDPRRMAQLQQMHAQWRKEYNTPGKKWDDLSVKWTDAEDQELRRAVQKARSGIGFISVK